MTGKQPFEAIVTQHGPTVLRVCRAILSPADADDAWSETFLAAMRAYPDLPPDANVEAWLVTIAHRKAIDATRAAARRPVPVAPAPDETRTPDGTRTPNGTHPPEATASADDDLTEAVARLPAKQKQAVAYHYLAGLPYAEIAAIVGGTADAVRRAAADGIATLRRTYASTARTPSSASTTTVRRNP
jgi:RNA polymerase sigma factor (sigma-70 family)